MENYPSLADVLAPHSAEQIEKIGYDDEWRSVIAENHGLDVLAVRDQQMRAVAEIGVNDAQSANFVVESIDAAIAWFMLRGFTKRQAPSPIDISKAVAEMADAARTIARSLSLIRVSRTGVSQENRNRACELKRIHAGVVKILTNSYAVPRGQVANIDEEGWAPVASRFEFQDPWTFGWEQIAHQLSELSSAVRIDELQNPTRALDNDLVDFIHRLGEIYQQISGRSPSANRRKPTQPADWRSPFVRFLREVWPLTPDGSQGQPPPEDGRIARALAATPSF